MLRARDVMRTKVATVTSRTAIPELEEILLRTDVSGLPVVDAGDLCGVVSRTDLVRALAGAEGSAEATLAYYHEIAGATSEPASGARMASERIATMTVRDIMATELITAAADEPVREVAQTMITRGIHRVLVTEGRRLLGIVTTVDLVIAIADGRLGESARA